MFGANVCMWLGLLLITFINAEVLVEYGPEPVLLYNPDTFIIFLGAVVVCFEGIGLVLPVRDSMEPHLQVRHVYCCIKLASICSSGLPCALRILYRFPSLSCGLRFPPSQRSLHRNACTVGHRGPASISTDQPGLLESLRRRLEFLGVFRPTDSVGSNRCSG